MQETEKKGGKKNKHQYFFEANEDVIWFSLCYEVAS